jgi:flagellin-like protein
MPRKDDRAVSSVIGTVLMLGITITVFAGVSVAVLAYFQANPHPPRADLAAVADANAGSYLVTNQGGESVSTAGLQLTVNRNGVLTSLTPAFLLAQLGPTWDVGETVCVAAADASTGACQFDTTQPIQGFYAVSGNSVVASQGTLPASSAGSCLTDTAPPTVLTWSRNPSDVTAATTGAVAITALLTDGCLGVDQATNPTLNWVVGGSAPASSSGYTATTMTKTAANTWQASVTQTWAAKGGQTLFYYLSGQKDAGGNAQANTPNGVQSEAVDLVGTSTFVATSTPTLGSVTNFANAQSATDGGTVARVAEAAASVNLNANGVDGAQTAGWTSAASATASDGAWATTGSPGQAIQVTLADPAGSTASITQVVLYADVSILGQGGADGFDLKPCLLTVCGTSAGTTLLATASTTTISRDVTSARPGGGTWAWSDITNLEAALTSVRANPTGETWRVDNVYAVVTYAPIAQTLLPDGAISFVGWSTPDNAFVSDNAYATYSQDTNPPDFLQYTLTDPGSAVTAVPTLPTTQSLTRVVVSAELSITNRNNDYFTLQACLGATCSTASGAVGGSTTDTVATYDVTGLRPGGGAWTWADVANLEVRINPQLQGQRDGTWRVDQVFATMTYGTTAYTNAITQQGGGSWTPTTPSTFQTVDGTYSELGASGCAKPAPCYYLQSAFAGSFAAAPPAGNTVTQVVLKAYVQTTKATDVTQLAACTAGGTCSTTSGNNPNLGSCVLTTGPPFCSISYDITSLRPGGGSWTVADFTGTTAYVQGRFIPFNNDGGGKWRIDAMQLLVTFADSSETANGENVAIAPVSWFSADPATLGASDDSWATFNQNTVQSLGLSLADPVGGSGTITNVFLKAELSITGRSNDDFTLQACFGLTCSAASPSLIGAGAGTTDATYGYDLSLLRPGGGSWSWTDINNLEARVNPVLNSGRDGTWRVDKVWVEVSGTTYALDARFGFTGVPAGTTQSLNLAYRTAGDTYTLAVCQDALTTCGAWTTRGTALTSTTLVQWVYQLTPAEYNGGAPRIRIQDATPTSPTQGTLDLDFVRVVTS